MRCQFKRKLFCCQAMEGMQIAHRGFDAPEILLSKAAANIEIESGEGCAVEDHADATNHNELEVILLQPGQKRLVILRHVTGLLPGSLIENRLVAGVPPTVALASTS